VRSFVLQWATGQDSSTSRATDPPFRVSEETSDRVPRTAARRKSHRRAALGPREQRCTPTQAEACRSGRGARRNRLAEIETWLSQSAPRPNEDVKREPRKESAQGTSLPPQRAVCARFRKRVREGRARNRRSNTRKTRSSTCQVRKIPGSTGLQADKATVRSHARPSRAATARAGVTEKTQDGLSSAAGEGATPPPWYNTHQSHSDRAAISLDGRRLDKGAGVSRRILASRPRLVSSPDA